MGHRDDGGSSQERSAAAGYRPYTGMPRAGRHQYAHGRRITKRRIVGAVVAVAVVAGGVAAAIYLPDWLRSRSAGPTSSPT